jgi:hypothetical protein
MIAIMDMMAGIKKNLKKKKRVINKLLTKASSAECETWIANKVKALISKFKWQTIRLRGHKPWRINSTM